jgi:hypothetical protein
MTTMLRLVAKIVLLPLGIAFAGIANAQTDGMSVILEKLTAEIKKLETSCREDIMKYCSTVTPGDGRVLHCMQAHEDKISPACAYDLNDVTLRAQETVNQLREAVSACRGDMAKFCGTIRPGEGRMAACLAANSKSVSQNCVEAVRKLQDR